MHIEDILIQPLVTETTMQAITKSNRYTFIVNRMATKLNIKHAIKELFHVEPVTVHTIVMKGGKRKIVGKRVAFTTDTNWKKAIIELKTGESIDLFETGEGKKDKKGKKKK